jgi:beta-lactamase class A
MKQLIMSRWIYSAVLMLICFSTGLMAGKLYYGVVCLDKEFKFINNALACSDAFVVKKHGYAALKDTLENFIQLKTQKGEVSDISIYFRDLQNGPTLGINEHVTFAPASLLKVPIMMTYLFLAENDPKILEKTLKFRQLKEAEFLRQKIPSRESIDENTPYAIRDLLRFMIVYSDNRAYVTLVQYLNQIYPDGQPFFDTIRNLGIIQPEDYSENNITTKAYASVFLQLYHSAFFEKKETSEYALSLLAGSDFKDGIVSGIPAGIPVAHKFGERVFENEQQQQQQQLHDCGIVYYPKNPYLLCVMIRGNDFDTFSGIISTISKMVYEEFESRAVRK